MKKAIALALVFVLTAALAIGGTTAYLKDEDHDVNVMTLGNVKIEQIEQERSENGELVDFTQSKPLYPATGEIAWNDNKVNINGHDYNMFGEKLINAVDKIVSVKNTGRSDAYFRTVIAIEDPFDTALLGFNVGDTGYTQSPWMSLTIDGTVYSVIAFTYDSALESGESSLPSLLQVYLKPEATNEDCEELGETHEILALSQAVQTEGFAGAEAALNAAFGEVNEDNVRAWFSGLGAPTMVATAEEFVEAVRAGGTVILTDDITMDNMLKIEDGAEVYLNLNGKTIDFQRNADFKPGNPLFYPLPGTKLTITGNGTVNLGDNFDAALVYPAGEVVIENGTFIRNRVPAGTSSDDVQTLFMGVKSVGASMVINGGYFDGGYYDANADMSAFSETSADIANRGKAADRNAFRMAVKNSVSLLVNLSWSSEAGTQDFRIYGGTFVGANPAWGDEGCAMPITPDYLRPWSYYQGTFLVGQQMYDDRLEIPSAYTITEGTTADGRPVYTVDYN